MLLITARSLSTVNHSRSLSTLPNHSRSLSTLPNLPNHSRSLSKYVSTVSIFPSLSIQKVRVSTPCQIISFDRIRRIILLSPNYHSIDLDFSAPSLSNPSMSLSNSHSNPQSKSTLSNPSLSLFSSLSNPQSTISPPSLSNNSSLFSRCFFQRGSSLSLYLSEKLSFNSVSDPRLLSFRDTFLSPPIHRSPYLSSVSLSQFLNQHGPSIFNRGAFNSLLPFYIQLYKLSLSLSNSSSLSPLSLSDLHFIDDLLMIRRFYELNPSLSNLLPISLIHSSLSFYEDRFNFEQICVEIKNAMGDPLYSSPLLVSSPSHSLYVFIFIYPSFIHSFSSLSLYRFYKLTHSLSAFLPLVLSQITYLRYHSLSLPHLRSLLSKFHSLPSTYPPQMVISLTIPDLDPKIVMILAKIIQKIKKN
jgi:hypothetical protein